MMLLSLTELIGRFHPVLVHLPIGILLLACLFQWLSLQQKFIVLRPAVPIALFLGMLSAAASCISGWLLSGSGDYDTVLVSRHQWLGISVFVVSLLLYLLYKFSIGKGVIKWISLVLVLLIIVTGHLGGSLTHGSGYLAEGWKNESVESGPAIKPIANVQEAKVYDDMIRPLFTARCYSCHGPDKMKGKLRLDSPEFILKGGKSGHTVVPGEPGESEMIEALLLPDDNKKHMPPKEKPQLTQNEIELLHWWISTGADFSKKAKELPQQEKTKTILISFQTGSVDNDPVSKPEKEPPKADEKLLQKIRSTGIQVMPVAVNSNYLSVNFTSALAGDKDIALLEPLQEQLLALKIGGTLITDSVLSSVGKLDNLQRLDLSNTAITDKGLSKLSSLKQLVYLNLVGTKVTTAGILQLKELKGLKNIYLYHTSVQPGEWANLQKAFPGAALDSGGYKVSTLEGDTTPLKAPIKYQ